MKALRPPTLRPPTLESLFVGAYVLFGVALGTRPISDNSAFVHLQTGIGIVRGGGIPGRDPYSFTAGGRPWVVQSWLPAWTYGVAHRIGGFPLVAVEQGILMGALAWTVARLASAGSPLRTAGAAGLAVAVGASTWSPRPLLFGLLCLAVLITVVERRWSPWWLLPVGWVWVSSHGSFPLGVVWLVAVGVGAAVDAKDIGVREWRYLGALAAGLLCGGVASPVGPELLAFPLAIADKTEVFRRVAEWRSPSFASTTGALTLAALVAALVLLLRARPPWRHVLPVGAFVALGLLAQRNLPAAGIVLAPALGHALRPLVPRDGGRRPLNVAAAAVVGLVAVVFLADAAAGPGVSTRGYPVEALDWLEEHGYLDAGRRLAHEDTTGCYLILREGGRVPVFIDDRVDMYPVRVTQDYLVLLDAGPESLAVLDRRGVDAVLWSTSEPLPTVLDVAPAWRRAYRDPDWVVFVRS